MERPGAGIPGKHVPDHLFGSRHEAERAVQLHAFLGLTSHPHRVVSGALVSPCPELTESAGEHDLACGLLTLRRDQQIDVTKRPVERIVVEPVREGRPFEEDRTNALGGQRRRQLDQGCLEQHLPHGGSHALAAAPLRGLFERLPVASAAHVRSRMHRS